MKTAFRSLISLVFGLAFAAILVFALGESPISAFNIIMNGSLGGKSQLGYSLFYATPLIFTGLAVSWALRAGLFNIGCEGQMAMAGVAMVAVSLVLPPELGWLGTTILICVGFLTGGIWGAIAGWLKAYRGCHEVLATILLNFVAYGLSSYLIVSFLKNPESQNPETYPISSSFLFGSIDWLGGQSALNHALWLALAAAFVFEFAMMHTNFGLYQRLIGGSPGLAKSLGMHVQFHQMAALFISGGLAGLASVPLVLANLGKAQEGFAAGNGFMGIAVALMGMNRGLGVVLAALLFGLLAKGSIDLDLDSKVLSRDLAIVIQALIVIFVASRWTWLERKVWKT